MYHRIATTLVSSLLLCLGLQATAAPITHPSGFTVDPPASLDVTFQVVPTYDEQEMVFAGWSGEKLDYFVAAEKLPPKYLDPSAYFTAVAHDLRAAWGGLQVGRQSTYKAGSLAGTVTEFTKPAKDGAGPTTLFMHFLTDGRVSFVATATVVPPATPTSVLDRSTQLLKTAHLAAVPAALAPQPSNESPLAGTWTTDDKLPDGRPLKARVVLSADRSFRTEVSTPGRVLFAATGAWSKQGDTLHWIYLRSEPPLPADKREDQDTVVSHDGTTLVLKSRATGKTRSFKRSP
jgi:hypothetical protein